MVVVGVAAVNRDPAILGTRCGAADSRALAW